jgi:hypothetical protein
MDSRQRDTRLCCQNPCLLIIESFVCELRFFFQLDLIAQDKHCENGDSFSLEEPSDMLINQHSRARDQISHFRPKQALAPGGHCQLEQYNL